MGLVGWLTGPEVLIGLSLAIKSSSYCGGSLGISSGIAASRSGVLPGSGTASSSAALSRHTAKEEIAAIGKGKWNADLTTYATLNVQDLHSGYLKRLYTSRDYEAGLVNMMKDKYEVTSICLSAYVLQFVNFPSPQGPV